MDNSIVAYHGSMHDFDAFSLDQIKNDGHVGHCDFGYGLYFGSESIARRYSDQHLRKNFSALDNEYWRNTPGFKTSARLLAGNILNDNAFNIANSVNSLDPMSPDFEAIFAFFSFLEDKLTGKRFLYKCQLFSGSEHWVLPLNKKLYRHHADFIARALAAENIPVEINVYNATTSLLQGQIDDHYYRQGHDFPNVSTSMFFLRAGFKGIAIDMDNYLCWDLSSIKIISKVIH